MTIVTVIALMRALLGYYIMYGAILSIGYYTPMGVPREDVYQFVN